VCLQITKYLGFSQGEVLYFVNSCYICTHSDCIWLFAYCFVIMAAFRKRPARQACSKIIFWFEVSCSDKLFLCVVLHERKRSRCMVICLCVFRMDMCAIKVYYIIIMFRYVWLERATLCNCEKINNAINKMKTNLKLFVSYIWLCVLERPRTFFSEFTNESLQYKCCIFLLWHTGTRFSRMHSIRISIFNLLKNIQYSIT
jgi:hypothetical protein